MADLPSGTVTFLFTDIEGSTRRWEEHPDAMREAVARHDNLLRDAVEFHSGHVVKTTGDGLVAVFAIAPDAVAAAIDGQLGLRQQGWAALGELHVRMGLHTGAAERRDGDYFGRTLNRAARLMAIAHGGQIVVSQSTEQLVRDALPVGVAMIDLGDHRLRDLGRSERVFQINHADLPTTFPPLNSLDQFPGELPIFLTSFIGREREIRAAIDALGQSRIVTLIGVGGVGKTRLALQVAADVLHDYAHGASFCELATVRDRETVPAAVAACLRVTTRPGDNVTANLFTFLRHKQLLLVLDNCEHVISAAGSVAEAIAHACPGVAVLATSREALGVDGELIRPVRSLEVPAVDGRADTTLVDSVRLFIDRATAVRPEFVVDAATEPAIAEICRQLDGVPLAIELAAARVGAMSVHEIASRLDQRFRLLTGGRRTAIERHQTLRGTVDWSYDLLDEMEARAFDRLAVFAGGFTLDAAEAVVAGDGIAADDVLDALSHLVARSMLVADDLNRVTRYRLLETLRQYANERLREAGESESVRRRHAEYYVQFAEAASAGVKSHNEAHWVRAYDLELGNVQAALSWCVAAEEADLAMRLAVSVPGLRRAGLARALVAAADMPTALQHPSRPEAIAQVAIDAFVMSADLDEARALAREMDAAFAAAGVELSPYARSVHSFIASIDGRTADALAEGDAAIELALATGDRHFAGLMSVWNALFAATAGDFEEATQRARQAFALAIDAGAPSLIALADAALGWALSRTGPDRAVVHFERAVKTGMALDSGMILELSRRHLAELIAGRGDLDRALALYSEHLEYAMQTGARVSAALTCASLAVDLANAGYYEIATTLLGALMGVELIRTRVMRTETLDSLRQALGAARFEEFTSRGRAIDIDDLAAYAHAEIRRLGSDDGRIGR